MYYNKENKTIIFDAPLKKEVHEGQTVYTGHQGTLNITINQKSSQEINQELSDKSRYVAGVLALILGAMAGRASSSDLPLMGSTLSSLVITGSIYGLHGTSNKAHTHEVYAPNGKMEIEDEASGNRLEIKDTFLKPGQGGPMVDAVLCQPDGKKFVHAYSPTDLSEEKLKDLQALVKGEKTPKELDFWEKKVCKVPSYMRQAGRE